LRKEVWRHGVGIVRREIVCVAPVLLPAVAAHEEPTIRRLSSACNWRVAGLLAWIPTHAHKDRQFENKVKPVACRTTQ